MGDTHTDTHTTLNVEVPAYKYAAPKKNYLTAKESSLSSRAL